MEITINDCWKILSTGFLIWILIPILMFSIGGILLLLTIIDLNMFTQLLSNAIIPWWVSILMNFKKFVMEFIFSSVLAIILIYYDVIEPITPKMLMRFLKPSK